MKMAFPLKCLAALQEHWILLGFTIVILANFNATVLPFTLPRKLEILKMETCQPTVIFQSSSVTEYQKRLVTLLILIEHATHGDFKIFETTILFLSLEYHLIDQKFFAPAI